MLLDSAGPPAPFMDVLSQQRARNRQLQLTKPEGALGRLEELSIWLAGARGECPPPLASRIRVVVFAGDHGIAQAGVSAYPSEVTAQMVGNFLRGGAAVNVLAAQVGATVRVVDLSVATDIADAPEETTRYKVRRSSGRIDQESALTIDETTRAILAGQAIADEEIDGGADLLIAGDMGIGNTTPATVLIALLTGLESHTLVGRGTGIDDDAWIRKTRAVRDASRRGRQYLEQPGRLVGVVGGADIAAMAGFLSRAAERRTPVVLDGDRVRRGRAGRGPDDPGRSAVVRGRPRLDGAGARRGAGRARPGPAARPRPAPRRGHRGAAGRTPAPGGGRHAGRHGDVRRSRRE